jgi:hypothetical protein
MLVGSTLPSATRITFLPATSATLQPSDLYAAVDTRASCAQTHFTNDFPGLIPLYPCSGVQCDSGLRGFVPGGLMRTQHCLFARTRSSISGNPAGAIILKCDCNAEHTHQDPTSDGLPPTLYSMACHRRRASLVACCADPCGRPVDRPTDNRGTHSAPPTGLDSRHAVSRTLQIHSAQPNLA